MLTMKGKCLGVQTETINGGPNGSFQQTTIHLLVGFESHGVRTGRDFPPADLPREGEDVELEVVVSAFSRRSGGAGYNFTAIKRVKSGARVAPVSNAS